MRQWQHGHLICWAARAVKLQRRMRRAEGPELDGESADRATIKVTAMSDTVRKIEYQILHIRCPER
jgi:hypothetical protein